MATTAQPYAPSAWQLLHCSPRLHAATSPLMACSVSAISSNEQDASPIFILFWSSCEWFCMRENVLFRFCYLLVCTVMLSITVSAHWGKVNRPKAIFWDRSTSDRRVNFAQGRSKRRGVGWGIGCFEKCSWISWEKHTICQNLWKKLIPILFILLTLYHCKNHFSLKDGILKNTLKKFYLVWCSNFQQLRE